MFFFNYLFLILIFFLGGWAAETQEADRVASVPLLIPEAKKAASTPDFSKDEIVALLRGFSRDKFFAPPPDLRGCSTTWLQGG